MKYPPIDAAPGVDSSHVRRRQPSPVVTDTFAGADGTAGDWRYAKFT
jgi:hypothetical protein